MYRIYSFKVSKGTRMNYVPFIRNLSSVLFCVVQIMKTEHVKCLHLTNSVIILKAGTWERYV